MILVRIRIQTKKKYMQNNSIYFHKIQFQAETYIQSTNRHCRPLL